MCFNPAARQNEEPSRTGKSAYLQPDNPAAAWCSIPPERAENLVVKVSRRGQSAAVLMVTLFENPKYNIFVVPGDVISVETPFRELVVLGATGNRKLSFTEANVSLADAIANAGGLINRRSNRKGVFLYRQTDREAAKALGADISSIPGATVPTIFRFDFTDPSVLFVASKFEIQDGDILYVSNSLNEEISAVISAISPFAPPPSALVGL